jgi:hypothetical protein
MLQRECDCAENPGAPSCDGCEQRQLQRSGDGLRPSRISAGGPPNPGVTSAIDASRGGGRPLERTARERLEPRLGESLGDVRVHDDAHAGALARAVSARAFAVGSDLFFAAGAYRPGSHDGDKLIAHEVTHAVQQRGAPMSGPLSVSAPDDAAEVEAEAMASTLQAEASAHPTSESASPEGHQPGRTAGATRVIGGAAISIARTIDPTSDEYQRGYNDGRAANPAAPGPLSPDAMDDYNEGYQKGKAESDAAQASLPPASAAPDSTASPTPDSPPVPAPATVPAADVPGAGSGEPGGTPPSGGAPPDHDAGGGGSDFGENLAPVPAPDSAADVSDAGDGDSGPQVSRAFVGDLLIGTRALGEVAKWTEGPGDLGILDLQSNYVIGTGGAQIGDAVVAAQDVVALAPVAAPAVVTDTTASAAVTGVVATTGGIGLLASAAVVVGVAALVGGAIFAIVYLDSVRKQLDEYGGTLPPGGVPADLAPQLQPQPNEEPAPQPEPRAAPDVDIEEDERQGCLGSAIAQRGGDTCHDQFAAMVSGQTREWGVQTPEGLFASFDGYGKDGVLYEVKTGYRFLLGTSPKTYALRERTILHFVEQSENQLDVADRCGYPLLWVFNDAQVAEFVDGFIRPPVTSLTFPCDEDG